MTGWEPYPLDLAHDAPAPLPPLLVRRGVESPLLGNRRDLLVALPHGYEAGDRRYPVVYMQDGQNLFDPRTAYAGHWGLAETLAHLAADDLQAIVVGIPNMGPARIAEYTPFSDPARGGGLGELYVTWVAEHVKPLVDEAFRTDPTVDGTVIAGSSLGGLVSLYALLRHPDTFGAAGVLSPALWYAERAMLRWVRSHGFRHGRVYLDVGTEEGTGTVDDVRRLRRLLLDTGYREQFDLGYVEELDAAHHEAAWGRRWRHAMPFLLGAAPAPVSPPWLEPAAAPDAPA